MANTNMYKISHLEIRDKNMEQKVYIVMDTHTYHLINSRILYMLPGLQYNLVHVISLRNFQGHQNLKSPTLKF